MREMFCINLGNDLHDVTVRRHAKARRLTLRSSQVGAVAPSHRPRWSHRRRLGLALDLLRDPVFDALVTGESRFDELPAVLPGIADGSLPGLCQVIEYPATEKG